MRKRTIEFTVVASRDTKIVAWATIDRTEIRKNTKEQLRKLCDVKGESISLCLKDKLNLL